LVSTNNNPRYTALKAVNSVIIDSKSLSSFKFQIESQQDNALAKMLSYGLIRNYLSIAQIIEKKLRKPFKSKDRDIFNIIALGVYQILFTKIPPHASINETVKLASLVDKIWSKSLVNAILRGVDREKEEHYQFATDHHNHPEWFIQKIKDSYPKDYKKIILENNSQGPMTLRINQNYGVDEFKTNLKNDGIDYEEIDELPQALLLKNPIQVKEIPDFEHGSSSVQDASAQLAAILLNPTKNEKILDACAAPGGKTSHIAEICPHCEISALEIDGNRVEQINENIERLSLRNVSVLIADASDDNWWDGKLFDKILIDAPCSATGIIRRHPDIKIHRKIQDITKLVKTQQLILDNLWQMLRPGGLMLYATCSILEEENSLQIKEFLNNHKDAQEKIIDLSWGFNSEFGKQKLPDKNFDGFYYALLQKA
jgi:16S rRNA (cytosine967-C5)-methyltransferase